jgi:hypothetical protein
MTKSPGQDLMAHRMALDLHILRSSSLVVADRRCAKTLKIRKELSQCGTKTSPPV